MIDHDSDSYRRHIGADGYVGPAKTKGPGISIDWSPDKATPEAVADALIERLRAYQDTPMVCNETAQAIRALGALKMALRKRDEDRARRGVTGTRER